jgi:hypothetical protein
MRVIAGLIVVMVSIGMVGCTDKDSVPSDIIPRDKMEQVLWDMILADNYATNVLAKDSVLIRDSAHVRVKMETLGLYNEVFRLHGVSREDFRKSYAYYQGRPEMVRNMFDSLLARGNRMRPLMYSKPQTPQTPPAIPPPGANIPKPASANGGVLIQHQPPPGMGNGTRNPVKPFNRPNMPPGRLPGQMLHKDSIRAIKPLNDPSGPASKNVKKPVD